MNFIQKIAKSLSMQGRAIGFIITNGMTWTLLMPLLIFIASGVAGLWSIGAIVQQIAEVYGADLSPLFFSIGVIVLKLLFFIVFGIWGGYIVVIIMSPFMAYVSEKTEHILNGKDYPFDLIQILKDALRGILLAIRNIFMELFLGFLISLIALFPIVGPLITFVGMPLILFVISAYYYGFSFIDYTNERRKLTVSQSVNFVKRNKAMAIGHGLIFALLLYIPIIGSFLSSIFAIVSTVAATIEMVEEHSDEKEILQLP